MRFPRLAPILLTTVLMFSASAFGQANSDTSTSADSSSSLSAVPAPPTAFDQVVDRVIEREHFFVAQMRHLHPLVETYIQDLKNDKDVTEAPYKDEYFLGRLSLASGAEDKSFLGQPGFGRRLVSKLTSVYSMKFLPLGFAQMV